jgi:hypothetical protein
MATVTQEFQSAPLGRRVIYTSAISFAGVLIACAFSLAVELRVFPGHAQIGPRVIATLAPLVGLLVAVPLFLYERAKVSRFRIQENCLVLGRKRFPLEGLASAERDPEVLKRAFKVYGNGGVGAIRGRFRSCRIGKFYAFLSGTENAVVLRWPDRAVAVSPADPDFFIMNAKSAAGLR